MRRKEEKSTMNFMFFPIKVNFGVVIRDIILSTANLNSENNGHLRTGTILKVYCSICQMTVHQSCYGITQFPTEDWMCSLFMFSETRRQREY
jgi:hypothetical protein